MISLFNKKVHNLTIYSSNKPLKIRPFSKLSRMTIYNKTQENHKNISININQNDDYINNYRLSTLSTETKEKSNLKLIANHTLYNRKKKNIKNNDLNELFKNTLFKTKVILRPKTVLKSRAKTISYTDTNKKINNIHKYHNKSPDKNKINGVPLTFIQSMRLNLKQNISKAKQFLKKEKNRLLKENPYMIYQIRYNNRQKLKKEEKEKIAQYKIWLESLNTNKKQYETNKLIEHHTKLLLKENNQYFAQNKPIIDKTKFDSKYRILTESNLDKIEVKHKEIKNMRKIFTKYLDNTIQIKKEKYKKGEKLSKEIIYQRIKSIIKKCAIEFKNIIIPLNEYIIYNQNSKKIIEYLFNEEYLKIIKMIKKEDSNIEKKDKDVINSITKNKFLIFTIDFYGQNILFFSIKYKLYKSLAKIIQLGSDVNHQDFRGRTALHFASKNNDLIAITILLYFSANPSIKDTNEQIPLDYIKNNGHDNYIIKELLIRCEIIRKLSKYRSWKEYEIYIRRGIQYYLNQNLSKEKYHLIFSFIDNVKLYYS